MINESPLRAKLATGALGDLRGPARGVIPYGASRVLSARPDVLSTTWNGLLACILATACWSTPKAPLSYSTTSTGVLISGTINDTGIVAPNYHFGVLVDLLAPPNVLVPDLTITVSGVAQDGTTITNSAQLAAAFVDAASQHKRVRGYFFPALEVSGLWHYMPYRVNPAITSAGATIWPVSPVTVSLDTIVGAGATFSAQLMGRMHPDMLDIYQANGLIFPAINCVRQG